MKKFINDMISSSSVSSIALSTCTEAWGNDIHSPISNKECNRHPICEIHKLWIICVLILWLERQYEPFSKKGVLSTFYLVEDKEVEQLFCCDIDSN